jgi:hypothetical protein
MLSADTFNALIAFLCSEFQLSTLLPEKSTDNLQSYFFASRQLSALIIPIINISG